MNQPTPSSLKVRLSRVITLPCGRLGSQGGAYLAMEISFKSAPANLLPADAASAGAITPRASPSRPASPLQCAAQRGRSPGTRWEATADSGCGGDVSARHSKHLRGQEKGPSERPPSKIRPCPVSCDCGILIFGDAQVHLPLKMTKHRPAEELVVGTESRL